MKKQLLAFFCLLLYISPINIYSQNQIYWQENFDDNFRQWWTGNNEKMAARVANGTYLFTQKIHGATLAQTKSVPIDPYKDFTVEAVIAPHQGSPSNSYGIIWGATFNTNSFNTVLLSINGTYCVAKVRNGVQHVLQSWRVERSIKPPGEKNIIKIIQEGITNKILINDKEVYSGDNLDFTGPYLGVLTTSAITVECKRLTVRQDNKINIVKDIPKDFKKENLGSNVNNSYDQIQPIIAPDGNTLFWSTRFCPDNTGGINDADEIWFSSFNSGNWTPAQNIGKPLNNKEPNWIISVTPDNNTMLTGNQYNALGEADGYGISITYRTKNGWSIPEDVKIEDFSNKGTFYQFFLSNDKKILLIAYDRGMTLGGNDLYFSFSQKDGSWSIPKNLGPIINSYADEYTPFLASDGVTLYYSSYGKPGFGNADVFVSKRLDSTWTNWSEPLNLGPHINTPMNEVGLTLTASGEYGYISSSDNSLGGLDIFRIKMPVESKPLPVVLVYGKVLNSKTKEPIAANITYRELATDKEVGRASSSPVDGSYKIVLPVGQVYSFLGAKENYYSIGENFDVKTLSEYKEIKKDLFLTPVEVGATVLLNNIFFDFGESTLHPESYPELQRAIEFLSSSPSIKVEVGGHTDNVGNDANNQTLSDNRAKAVVEYLTSHGVAADRVSSKGFGKTKPVATNDTEEDRKLNRRVEFTILKK